MTCQFGLLIECYEGNCGSLATSMKELAIAVAVRCANEELKKKKNLSYCLYQKIIAIDIGKLY